MRGLYFINKPLSQDYTPDQLLRDCKTVLDAGRVGSGNIVAAVQYREKDPRIHPGQMDDVVEIARRMQTLCREYGVPFIMNDYVDVAIAIGADGVHVGQDDMDLADVRSRVGPHSIIGVSCSTLDEALVAQEGGANYLGVASIFTTVTKADATIIGIEGLQGIRSQIDIPIVALGGVNFNNLSEVLGHSDSICMISALYNEGGLSANVGRFSTVYGSRPVTQSVLPVGSRGSSSAYVHR
jgi:thiamine-phosphate pyrophosphorylase